MSLLERIDLIVDSLLPKAPVLFDKIKYVNDPVWGNISLLPHEQAIIDTPLFQRLRYIHQTGFTFFTFPTANHSRFEHSLGVMHIASRIFDVLKSKNSIQKPSLTRLRLAALLHDSGHSAFSHTSEEFYAGLQDITDFKTKHKEFKDKGAGEILSHLIVMSKPFQAHFEKMKTLYPEIKEINISHVANLISGKPISDEFGYEADIISGPIDADKLDYFPRDGRYVGIEVSLDIERLINCVEIQETSFFGQKRKSLVINRRGYNSLQQLLFARATLTASVYHHHKVRACDNMLKNVIQAYIDKGLKFHVCKKYPKGIDFNQTPNYLLVTDLDFKSELNNVGPETICHKLLNDLFNRNLFKRVLKISIGTIAAKEDRGDEGLFEQIKAELSQFINLKRDKANRKLLIEAIIKESGANISEYEMSIDIPYKPSFEKAGLVAINLSSDNRNPEIVSLKHIVPIEEWIKGYERYFGHTYIFTSNDRDVRIKIAIAAAKIFSGVNGFPNLNLTIEAVSEDIRDDVKKIVRDARLGLFRL